MFNAEPEEERYVCYGVFYGKMWVLMIAFSDLYQILKDILRKPCLRHFNTHP